MALNFIKARTKPCILGPTLPRECKRTALTTSSTQHMWELLAGNHTAAFPRHAQQKYAVSQ